MSRTYKESMNPRTIDKLKRFKRMLEGGQTVGEVSKVFGVSNNWYHKTDKKYRDLYLDKNQEIETPTLPRSSI